MCKAALERLTTGLAAELYPDGIAVNSLGPAALVLTEATRYHRLDEGLPESAFEAPEVMAEAALALCSGDPRELTGRIVDSQPLLQELGRSVRSL